MGVKHAALVVALGTALLPSDSNAQAMSAEAIIAACQSRAKLTDQWNPLQAERDQLAQRLKDFGFENASAQQDAMGDRAAEILRENGVNARKDLMAKSANEAATAMTGFLENIKNGGRALNNAERGQLQQMARRLPDRAREAIMEIAQAPRLPIPGSPIWSRAIDAVGYASTAHTLATTESAGRLAWEGFMAGAGVVNPPLGLVVSNLDYAANNLWGLGQLAWTGQQIKALTNATEADLELMKATTNRMKVVGEQLGKIRAGLSALPPCDSTQLTRGDLGPTPQPPAAASTTGSSAAGSGGGMSAGAIAGVTAAGAAGGVGLWYLSEAQKKAQCDALESEAYTKVNGLINSANALSGCGSSTSCFNTRISALNSAFSSFNSAIGNWCTCLGPSATSELTAADKAMVRDMFSQMRSIGVSPGTLPACFR